MNKITCNIFFLFFCCLFCITVFPKIDESRLEKMKIFYKDLPVLVTGGAGFIGSHLTDKLVELGAKVTVIDDLSNGKIENLKNVIDKITFIKKSIVDKDVCMQATEGKAVIFHLAAIASVPRSLKYPNLYKNINIDGIYNLLDAARFNYVPRFVFSSSSSVYGPKEEKYQEDMKCFPLSPYGASKLIGELFCDQFSKHFGVKSIVLRYFNVFGDRQNPNGEYAAVIPKFKKLMEQNLPLPVYGDGLQTRDFTPVERVVEANLVVAMIDYSNEKNIFNIGTGKSINILQVIDMLKQEFPNYTNKIDFKPPRQGDARHTCADCSRYDNLKV